MMSYTVDRKYMEDISTHETNVQVEVLAKILQEHGIDTSLYGVGKAKSIHSLLIEILEGECYLVVSGKSITRHITMTALLIENGDGNLLVETNQYFYSTSTRDAYSRVRYCPVSEKLLSNELPEVAIRRALKEELSIHSPTSGSDINTSETITNEYSLHSVTTDIEERLSDSYPGLVTVYTRYIAKITFNIEYLDPIFKQQSFTITEYNDHRLSPRLDTTWTWMSIADIRQVGKKGDLFGRCLDITY